MSHYCCKLWTITHSVHRAIHGLKWLACPMWLTSSLQKLIQACGFCDEINRFCDHSRFFIRSLKHSQSLVTVQTGTTSTTRQYPSTLFPIYPQHPMKSLSSRLVLFISKREWHNARHFLEAHGSLKWRTGLRMTCSGMRLKRQYWIYKRIIRRKLGFLLEFCLL